MIRNYKIEAIVLKRVNLGETDRIITFFAKKYGKIHAVARGVRKITSKRAPHLEVFTQVKAMLAKGKNLDIVTEVQTIRSFQTIRQNLSDVSTAFWIIEEVERLCPERYESDHIFDRLINTLRRLDEEDTEKANLIDIREEFSLTILKELGYLPVNKNLRGETLNNFLEGILERRMKSRQLFTSNF